MKHNSIEDVRMFCFVIYLSAELDFARIVNFFIAIIY